MCLIVGGTLLGLDDARAGADGEGGDDEEGGEQRGPHPGRDPHALKARTCQASSRMRIPNDRWPLCARHAREKLFLTMELISSNRVLGEVRYDEIPIP